MHRVGASRRTARDVCPWRGGRCGGMCLKLTKIIQSLVLRAPSWIHSTRKDVDIYACIRLGAQHSPGETVATKYMQTEMEVLHEDMG